MSKGEVGYVPRELYGSCRKAERVPNVLEENTRWENVRDLFLKASRIKWRQVQVSSLSLRKSQPVLQEFEVGDSIRWELVWTDQQIWEVFIYKPGVAN